MRVMTDLPCGSWRARSSGPAQPSERPHRLATASVGSSCFARKWIWKGDLWIATSAMSAFSHEGEGRTSFVCGNRVQLTAVAWLDSSAATELLQCGDRDRSREQACC